MNYNVKISIEKDTEVSKETIPHYAKCDFIDREVTIDLIKTAATAAMIKFPNKSGLISGIAYSIIQLINAQAAYHDDYDEDEDSVENIMNRLTKSLGCDSTNVFFENIGKYEEKFINETDELQKELENYVSSCGNEKE